MLVHKEVQAQTLPLQAHETIFSSCSSYLLAASLLLAEYQRGQTAVSHAHQVRVPK
jgi:hypothetical protein